MIVLTILLGLIGLGFVIVVHELGHLFAARAFGIEVEAFAVGWGKPLKRFRLKGTEYRINLFPVGGYCKLKGEEAFREAIENKYAAFPKEPGSLFSAAPWKRLLTYAAGPLFNLLLAGVLFSSVWMIGYQYATYSNRIAVSSKAAADTPSREAGLMNGDTILSLNGQATETFADIQDTLVTAAGKTISLKYSRNGIVQETSITPRLNPQTGAGMIGISAWIDPLITGVSPGSPEEAAGFAPGDRITGADGRPIEHIMELIEVLENPEVRLPYRITVERDGKQLDLNYIPNMTASGEPAVLLQFPYIVVENKAKHVFDAIGKGIGETVSTFSLTVSSIRALFQGLEVQEAMAGPIKITYLVGEAAAAGFRQSFVTGVRTLLQLLGFISVALGFANLLPIPVLDGGQMVLAVSEWVTRRSISPRKYYVIQIVGFAIIFSLIFFTLFNDIRFFLS